MKILTNKTDKFLKLGRSSQKNQTQQSLMKLAKKLVALSLLATFTIGIGACGGKKTASPAGQNKIQLDVSAIVEAESFYVTPRGKAENDGSSWQNAKDLQSAINEAATDPSKKFVLVAQGSYYADLSKADVKKSFILKDGVKIYGGFDTSSQELKRYKDDSILEGDLGENKNSELILKGNGLTNNSVLDGFIIQNGLNKKDGSTDEFPQNTILAAGIYLYNSSPKLANLSFKNNSLTGKFSYGGAISNWGNSNPSISNVSFIKNSAYIGGAIFNSESSPIINNSYFEKNVGTKRSGAIGNRDSNPSINNTIFKENKAESGGTINNFNSSPKISNSIFMQNTVTKIGAVFFNNKSNPLITNAVFINNKSDITGAVMYNTNSSPKIYNSILWNNKDMLKGTEAINNIYNANAASQPIIKNSILNIDSAVTKTSSGNTPEDLKQTEAYNFMDFSDTAKFNNNQTPEIFSISADGKVASANQVLIKDKGDNSLYLEVYDLIKGTTGTAEIPSDDKDLAGKPRLSPATTGTIDIGAYEIEQ